MDRHGADGGASIATWGWAAYVFLPFGLAGAVVAHLYHLPFWAMILMAIGGAFGSSAAVLILPHWLGRAAGGLTSTIMMGGNRGRGEDTFSIEDSLVMQGLLGEAAARFDERIAAEPDFIALRMRAAELHASSLGDHARAAELFRGVRSHPRATAAEEILACNRLADLYLGPLNDPGRAVVELRRIVVRHPASGAASHARAAIRQLKADPEGAPGT